MSVAPKQDRLISIDALRGVAVLGILMMNIQVFAMIPEAYEYPLAHMDLTGLNLSVWAISNTFFNMKFITIFSALFGAGIILMVGDGPTNIHYRRMLWLLLIGMIHAYVFWFGDILVSYAIFGMLAVLMRKWKPINLTLLGAFLIALVGGLITLAFWVIQFAPGSDPIEMGMAKSPEDLEAWVTAYQTSFAAHLPHNAMYAFFSQLFGLIFFGGRILGVMLLGMALFKVGFFHARWSGFVYAVLAAITLTVGLGLAHIGTQIAIESNFDLLTVWKSEGANYVGSLLAAFGYASVVMLLCKIGFLKAVMSIFAATGQMAFTNYLSQTLIMTFIFVGTPGLGLFGTMERIDQAKLVMIVWAAQLIWSPIWLSMFRYGPLEWVWRSLTYGKFQRLLKKPKPS